MLDSFYSLQQEYDRASSEAISTVTAYSDAQAEWSSQVFGYTRIINHLRSDLELHKASLAARAELVSVKISQVDHLAQKLQSLTEKHIALQQQFAQSCTHVEELTAARLQPCARASIITGMRCVPTCSGPLAVMRLLLRLSFSLCLQIRDSLVCQWGRARSLRCSHQ